ncbi:MAG: LysE family translocator [Phaeovulum sp.]|uniref:LysE family translocator n=1 Tax=Phaeovulum sp. TaxID=2934796 RepID=UPI00273438C9|nr:LysE family translocator [Phaeovulum sp.]MDP3862226.1 LysE family translocator [Phaeovulum sp.]
MDQTLFLALASFAFVTSVTPGPNNLMLLASGANFGLRRTLPHMLGVAVGFAVMLLSLGAGVVGVFAVVPQAWTVLKAVSVAYMIWLAWKIATAAPPAERVAGGRPFSFLQAVAFQWVNPKAWAMALTALAVYAPVGGMAGVGMVAAVFTPINLGSISLWAGLGTAMQGVLHSRARMRAFNGIMAALLLASLWPVLATGAH